MLSIKRTARRRRGGDVVYLCPEDSFVGLVDVEMSPGRVWVLYMAEIN